MTFLVIWNRIGDYHRARLKALGENIGFDNIVAADFGVADGLYQWDNTSNTRYAYATLSQKEVNQTDIFNRLKNYRKLIKKYHVELVCIPGYGKIEYVLFILLAWLMRKRVILFAESWYGNGKLKNYLKGMFLNFFVNRFFVSGIRAEEHFNKKLGIPLHKIQKGYSVVDNHHFSPINKSTGRSPYQQDEVLINRTKSSSTNQLVPESKQEEVLINRTISDSSNKQMNASTNKPVLLCVARYHADKNLLTLIKAYQQSNLYKNWKLVLIGDGPQKKELKELIGDDSNWISLEGWKNYEELPNWYQNATAFILPSLFEPWGLVVNEAMAAGLPVIVSCQCGCIDELITAQNGVILTEVETQASLSNSLSQLSNYSIVELEIMGKVSVQLIEHFGVANWASTLNKLSGNA